MLCTTVTVHGCSNKTFEVEGMVSDGVIEELDDHPYSLDKRKLHYTERPIEHGSTVVIAGSIPFKVVSSSYSEKACKGLAQLCRPFVDPCKLETCEIYRTEITLDCDKVDDVQRAAACHPCLVTMVGARRVNVDSATYMSPTYRVYIQNWDFLSFNWYILLSGKRKITVDSVNDTDRTCRIPYVEGRIETWCQAEGQQGSNDLSPVSWVGQ